MHTSAVFGAKTSNFSKFMACPHGEEGRGCGHFSDKGVNFSRFCAYVFYGRPFKQISKSYTRICTINYAKHAL